MDQELQKATPPSSGVFILKGMRTGIPAGGLPALRPEPEQCDPITRLTGHQENR